MMSSITFAALISRLSPALIVVLSIISGYTTYHGLSFFIPSWIALGLTVSIQVVIVMSALQFARAHWNANPWRPIGAFCCLLFSGSVSIYFSYFTFVEFSEASALRQRKFAVLNESVQKFASDIQTLKSRQIVAQVQKVETARKNAELALGGKLPDGRPLSVGPGPVYKFYVAEAEREEKQLKLLQGSGEGEKRAAEARAYLVGLGAEGLREERNYQKLLDLLSRASKASDEFAVLVGEQPVAAPEIIEFREYVQVVPSLQSLRRISWLSMLLAGLVDFLTIVLSYWLEQNPFGRVKRIDRDRLVQQLLSFRQWGVNGHDQLEFRLPKTEWERASGVHDADRLFAASVLLNKGYLRRVDGIKAEFSPALYDLLNEFFRDNNTQTRS